VARNRCLCFPNPFVPKSPKGPFWYFCPALVSPLIALCFNFRVGKKHKRHILQVIVESCCQHGQYNLCMPKKVSKAVPVQVPLHLRSSHPFSTAKQSESIMRDSCSCCCCQCGQKQVLMLPKSFVPKSPRGPFQHFCPALLSPLRSVSTSELARGTKGIL